MKNSCILVLLVVGLLLAATGCVQPVEIAPPEEREVFVKCILEKGATHQQVLLLYSGGIGEDQFEPVTNAAVTINGHKFENLGDGLYDRLMEPRSGETYTLQVEIPGRERLEATTRMPQVSIESHFDPPEEWFLDGHSNNYVYSPWLNPWARAYDSLTFEIMKEKGGECMLSAMPGMIFRLNSSEHQHLFVLGRVEDSTGVIATIQELATNHLLVDKVNENGHPYLIANRPDLADTAQRPKYEYYIKRNYEGLPLHENYLRIDYPENYDNGLKNIHNLRYNHWDAAIAPALVDAKRYFVIIGNFEYNIWSAYDRKEAHPVLYFCSVSEEYDRYLRSVQASLVDAEGDLLSTLYGEASGYSNIKGGYGVFGAINTLRHDCDVMWGTTTGSYFLPAYQPYDPYPARLPAL